MTDARQTEGRTDMKVEIVVYMVSKVKWPGFTISRYVVKLQRLVGKAKNDSKFLKFVFLQ